MMRGDLETYHNGKIIFHKMIKEVTTDRPLALFINNCTRKYAVMTNSSLYERIIKEGNNVSAAGAFYKKHVQKIMFVYEGIYIQICAMKNIKEIATFLPQAFFINKCTRDQIWSLS